MLLVMPNIINLINFKTMAHVFSPALKNYKDNVSFLNTDDLSFKIGCDWCSLNNGLLETVRQNCIKDNSLLDKIDVRFLKSAITFFDFVLISRKEKINEDKIICWCYKNFNNHDDKKRLLGKLYLQLEEVELRWCPFKRSKEFYYRNQDPRYFTPSEANLYKIGKILSQKDKIECNKCAEFINSSQKKEEGDSPFSFLVDEIVKKYDL
jgi:hypothetical protein